MYRHLTTMLKLLTIFMVILNSDHADAVMTPSLQTHLDTYGTAHVMVVLKHEIKHVVNSINSRRFNEPHTRAATLVRELREYTQGSQKNVLNFLGRREPMGNVKPFWITNKISVRNATLQMLQELVTAHGDEIEEIREAVTIALVNPIPENVAFIPGNMRPSRPAQTPPFGPGSVSGNMGPSPFRPEQISPQGSESTLQNTMVPPPSSPHQLPIPGNMASPPHATPPVPDMSKSIPNMQEYNVPAPILVPEPKTAITPSWGIANIRATEAHKKGYRGQRVVVAVVDSGARRSHEILRHNMRPTYNWFDAQNHTDKPIDAMGHGTHCTGTAVGWDGFGVAPGSQWIACRIFDESSAAEDVILVCAQWVTCPSLPDGTHEDCSMRPHVASNSWGGSHSDFFNDPILAWNCVSIIPVFAIGNAGPQCRTAGSPGDQDHVISVGATDIFNNLAGFSSRGPSGHIGHPQQKPEVSAPGRTIMSASHQADNKYVVLSGTSMATPHVTGTVALLLSKKPTATFKEIKDVLQSTAWRSSMMKPNPNTCREGLANLTGTWPNNLFGAGVIRADTALQYI